MSATDRTDRTDGYEAERIRAALAPGFELEVHERLASTNALLMQSPGTPRARLVVAEEQSAGRGRRGRRWQAAPGTAILFSLGRTIARPVGALAGLSIAAGVALARDLRALGAPRVALKWPNDLLLDEGSDGAKLGGVLVETRGAAGDPTPGGAGPRASATWVVAGIGLNWRSDERLARALRRPIGALDQALDPLPTRSALVARLATALNDAFTQFEREGLGPFLHDWQRLHAHEGRRLRVRLADGRSRWGTAAGLAADGALQLQTRKGMQRVHAGQVRLARAA